jgi:hypothetical protein
MRTLVSVFVCVFVCLCHVFELLCTGVALANKERLRLGGRSRSSSSSNNREQACLLRCTLVGPTPQGRCSVYASWPMWVLCDCVSVYVCLCAITLHVCARVYVIARHTPGGEAPWPPYICSLAHTCGFFAKLFKHLLSSH